MKQAYFCILAMLAGCSSSTDSAPTAQALPQPQFGAQHDAAPLAQRSAPATANPAAMQLNFVMGYAKGCEQAQAARKPILLFFTAEWCRYCHQMGQEAFVHPQVVSLSEQFVCVLVDADTESDVCRRFGVQAYPTVQFVSPRGVPLNRLVGKKPAQQVVTAMQAALQSVARRVSSDDRQL